MKTNSSRYNLGFKRKRDGVTDYRKRLKILMSKKPRLVIRRSLKHMQASLVEFTPKGDIVKITAHSSQLKKLGWKYDTGNMPSAYLVGYIAGKKALKIGIKEAILDLGLQKAAKGSRLFAVLAGALEAGLQVPHGEEVIPKKERLTGTHIKKYAETFKDNKEGLTKQFGSCIKNDAKPEQISAEVEKIKASIGK